ncbi:VCBS repeat-containing protein [Candidatus Roizmanbacteria bacterium]|nr:VCBS repeat-containing protein [Candidatus Roizmanbacteria bacterium]
MLIRQIFLWFFLLLLVLFLGNTSRIYAASAFTDSTSAYGLSFSSFVNRPNAWADFDNDGDLDLYFTRTSSSTNSQFLINNGPNTPMTESASSYGLSDVPEVAFSASWIDIDNDRDFDLYVSNFASGGSNLLFINNGAGQTFTNATSTYDLDISESTTKFSAAWADVNSDGYLDVYIIVSSANNKLYVNNGPNTEFTDATDTYGVANGTSSHRSATWVDIDNDGDMDLYVLNSSANNILYRNNGPDTAMTDVTSTYEIEDGTTGHQSASWGDIDNDGDLDLYSINSSPNNNKLFINNGPETAFTEDTSTYGLADGSVSHISSSWIDIDNDGDLDVYNAKYTGNNNTLYINNGPNQSFTEAAAEYGLTDGTANHTHSHWIDIDNDGDMDVFISGDTSTTAKLYTNPGQGGNYLKVHVNNSSGLYQYDARVEIDADGNGDFAPGARDYMMQYQTNSAYGGNSGQLWRGNEPVGLYFGLGSDSSCKYDVRVFLPGTDPDSSPDYLYTDVCPNQTLATGWVTTTLNTKGAISDTTVVFTGTASTTRNTLSNVQFQIDSTTGDWTNCSADNGVFDETSENFTCTISNLGEGNHTLFLRARDNIVTYSPLGISTASVGSDRFVIDRTGPLGDIKSNGVTERVFQLHNEKFTLSTISVPSANLAVSYPSFTFTTTNDNDSGSGISKYQIIIKKDKLSGGDGNEQVYIDDIPAKAPDFSTYPYIIDNENIHIEYRDKYTVFLHAKKQGSSTDKELSSGGYRYKARAVDQAGNTIDTAEHVFLINTYSANFSGEYFPLSVQGVAGKSVNIFNLLHDPLSISLNLQKNPVIATNNKIPHVWGITPVGAEVTVTIEQPVTTTLPDGTKETTYTLIHRQKTAANESSEWGMTLEVPLSPGVYRMVIEASRGSDYTRVPDIVLTVV